MSLKEYHPEDFAVKLYVRQSQGRGNVGLFGIWESSSNYFLGSTRREISAGQGFGMEERQRLDGNRNVIESTGMSAELLEIHTLLLVY